MDVVELEANLFSRPSPQDIKSSWQTLFSDPLLSLSKLKSSALSSTGIGPSIPSTQETNPFIPEGTVLLRSVHWRIYHSLLPTPTSLDLFPPSLEVSRATYTSLRRKFLLAPDGRWANDCSLLFGDLPGHPSQSSHHGKDQSGFSEEEKIDHRKFKNDRKEGTQGAWDPLSLDGSSPWKTWFAHLELRGTIRQDVERTFPDIPYFRGERVRRSLTSALFLWSVLNPDVGYRQGMHELLAVCLLAVDLDSLDSDDITENGTMADAMRATLDRRYVEHDAFAIFQNLMRNAKSFYEWRSEEGVPKIRSPTAAPAPIITRCNYIQNSLLRRVDPQLRETLDKEGVEGQLYLIRWIRLLFTRELPFGLAMRLWDGVFSEDPSLGLLDYICITMLLLIRNELIDAEYPTLLTHLLHFPSPSPTYPFQPHLIISQALFLRNTTSPAGGVEVVLQNRDLLGIKVKPPDQSPWTPHTGSAGPPRLRPTGLAQGLYARAQAAGWDTAILSAVGDLRKNLPDSATAYSYLPALPFSPLSAPIRDPYSTIPSTSALIRPTGQISTSPFSPTPRMTSRGSVDSSVSIKSLRDAERDLAELRLAMLGMGKAMSGWVDRLKTKPQDEEAWKGLERVRDGLLDAAGKEVEEIVGEWGWNEGLESRSTTPIPSSYKPNSRPTPLPLDENHHRGTVHSTPGVDGEKTPTQPNLPVMSPATTNMPQATMNGKSEKAGRVAITQPTSRSPPKNVVSSPSTIINERLAPPSSTSFSRAEPPPQPRPNPIMVRDEWQEDPVVRPSNELVAKPDPLAGLGTTTLIPTRPAQKIQDSSRVKSTVADPLGAGG
ncbi:hypothetical protein M231_03648 [Tremella mesenterica]|uniref:Rab-GAP TBC domain-containing protein n=1 Tax=Tremella mesenterica TaxID=5217 RepID=A0A4Q1BMT4_TREME|nr:hypothetical protein M231_03648 [Tremella mesenterica]